MVAFEPNFPVGLDIAPSHAASFHTTRQCVDGVGEISDEWDQEKNIRMHGIAGRVWDASYPIIPYLSRPLPTSPFIFDPPCSLFASDDMSPISLLELGSGQSMAALHFADEVMLRDVPQRNSAGLDVTGIRAGAAPTDPTLFLTDLESVTLLCQKNVERWKERVQLGFSSLDDSCIDQGDGAGNNGCSPRVGSLPDVQVWPLAWGDADLASRQDGLLGAIRERKGLTHVLLVDLIYFPFLYPSLMRTLLQITMPPFARMGHSVEVILSYKSRSLEFEEPFFVALSRYFTLTPVLSRPRAADTDPRDAITFDIPEMRPHGREDDVHIYILHRRKETLADGWVIPEADEEIMLRGGVTTGDAADRGWGWLEEQLGAIEWDG